MKGQPAKSLLEALAYTAGFVRGWVGMLASPAWLANPKHRIEILPGGGPLARRVGGLTSLRRALFGSNKRQVAATLGPPPAAAMAGTIATFAQQSPQFWNADTWYYPFDPTRRSAVAVRFRRGRVNHVEFIDQVA
jgi:hypothetical protein